MNRLVIIGNGFDLAHGLPTSYKDFIDDYWKTKCETNGTKRIKYKDDLVEINCEFGVLINDEEILAIDNINNFQDIIQFVNRNKNNRDGVFEITFFNKFFKIICELSAENWVDIESLYYSILKNISKRDFRTNNYPWGISQLNEEFEQIKNLLEKYLIEKVLGKFTLDFYPDSKGDIFKFGNILTPKSDKDNFLNLFNELPKKDYNDIKFKLDESIKNTSLLVLNFNYTPTVLRYLRNQCEGENSTKIYISIHGTLQNELDNKINFGFGDEMDDDYKAIENLDDNEYLRNFKSFQYLQNNNYKKLLDFIDSEKYQVLIMGHSCGLSDRTLLNTVFEHDFCKSIKVFYHLKKDGTDNYTEIIQNISRHFNKKKLMREKIVNKTLCQLLPQIQLPLK